MVISNRNKHKYFWYSSTSTKTNYQRTKETHGLNTQRFSILEWDLPTIKIGFCRERDKRVEEVDMKTTMMRMKASCPG